MIPCFSFCKTLILFFLVIACFPLHQIQSHLSFLTVHNFYSPLILLSSVTPLTHIFLKQSKLNSTPSEDLTVLTIANNTPCVSQMTLLCVFFSFFFPQQFDIVGFWCFLLSITISFKCYSVERLPTVLIYAY